MMIPCQNANNLEIARGSISAIFRSRLEKRPHISLIRGDTPRLLTTHCPLFTDHSSSFILHPSSFILLFLFLLPLLPGCAGYQLGNRSLYPCDIRTVYVPMFESVSFRRNLGEWLTEAVMKEIERRTDYKVVNDPNADSTLYGRLVGEGKRIIVRSKNGDPREVQVNMQVQVSWIDRRGNPLRNIEPIPLPQELVDVGATGDLVPEVGQSIATAQQQAIVRLAQQIVDLMEAPW
jgi:hypothetical protein